MSSQNFRLDAIKLSTKKLKNENPTWSMTSRVVNISLYANFSRCMTPILRRWKCHLLRIDICLICETINFYFRKIQLKVYMISTYANVFCRLETGEPWTARVLAELYELDAKTLWWHWKCQCEKSTLSPLRCKQVVHYEKSGKNEFWVPRRSYSSARFLQNSRELRPVFKGRKCSLFRMVMYNTHANV